MYDTYAKKLALWLYIMMIIQLILYNTFAKTLAQTTCTYLFFSFFCTLMLAQSVIDMRMYAKPMRTSGTKKMTHRRYR